MSENHVNRPNDIAAEAAQALGTEQHVIPPYSLLEIDGSLPPIGTIQVERHGQPVVLEALASIRTSQPDSPEATIVIAKDTSFAHDGQKDQFCLVGFNSAPALDGRPVDASGGIIGTDPGSASITLPTGNLSVNQTNGRRRRTTIAWQPSLNTDEPYREVEATVSDKAAARITTHGEVSDRIRSQDRLAKLGRGALLTLGLYAAVKSGGLADQSLDYHQRADTVVHETLDVGPLPETLDGIRLESFSADGRARIIAEHAERQLVVDRVARSMQDMDDHNYDAIRARAETFRQLHAGELMTTDMHERLSAELEATVDHQEALTVFNKFMAYYGKSAEFTTPEVSQHFAFDTATPAEDTRLALGAIMDTYAPLPASMLRDAGFARISLMTPQGNTIGLGSYGIHDTDGEIFLPIMANAYMVGHTARHEFAHATQSVNTGNDTARNSLIYAAHELLGYPIDSSYYAATGGPGERDAENLAATLNLGELWLNPDLARRFGSEATEQILHKLESLEAAYPGISDYLLTQNSNFGR